MRRSSGRVVAMLCLAVVVGWGASGSALGAQVAAAKPESLEKIPGYVEAKDFSMSLWRGQCYGNCPIYDVTLAGDGTLRFHGDSNVLIRGDHVTHVPPAVAQALLDKFRHADFLGSKADYGTNVDSAQRVLTLTIGGNPKSVQGDDVPPAIAGLMSDLAELALRWSLGTKDTAAALTEERWNYSATTAENLGIYTRMILIHGTSVVEKYLGVGAPIISADGMKLSPVCVASVMGDETLVHRMLASVAKADASKSATLSMPPDAKYECLAAAAASGKVSLFNFWLDQGPPMEVPPVGSPGPSARWDQWWPLQSAGDVPRWTPIASFVKNGLASDSLPMVRRMLDFSDTAPKDFQDGLVTALPSMDPKADDGREMEIVRLLLGAGAKVDEQALFVAAGYQGSERVEIVRLLLSQRPEPRTLMSGGLALSRAVHTGGPGAAQTIRLLLDAGADLHKVAFQAGPTALFDASCLPESLQKRLDQMLPAEERGSCTPEVVKPLLEKGLDLNALDTNGYTALITFAAREDMVRELLADGADPTIVGKDGSGARQIAGKYGCAACVVLIDDAVEKRAAGVRH